LNNAKANSPKATNPPTTQTKGELFAGACPGDWTGLVEQGQGI